MTQQFPDQNQDPGQQPPAGQPPAGQPSAAQPQYGAPQAPGQQPDAYQAPPQQGAPQYGAPQGAPADQAGNNVVLNYWLSVFFVWLPALIFWLIDKDKGNARANAFNVANLNFSLLRTGVWVVTVIIGWIPYIGWLIAMLLWIASIVLFVFHIMAAAKAPEAYRNNGKTDNFVFNIPLIK